MLEHAHLHGRAEPFRGFLLRQVPLFLDAVQRVRQAVGLLRFDKDDVRGVLLADVELNLLSGDKRRQHADDGLELPQLLVLLLRQVALLLTALLLVLPRLVRATIGPSRCLSRSSRSAPPEATAGASPFRRVFRLWSWLLPLRRSAVQLRVLLVQVHHEGLRQAEGRQEGFEQVEVLSRGLQFPWYRHLPPALEHVLEHVWQCDLCQSSPNCPLGSGPSLEQDGNEGRPR